MSFETISQAQCEQNKKVTYRQKKSIKAKKATRSGSMTSASSTFPYGSGEVIESGKFDKIVRDCRGNLMRESVVRRFRRVGSDEWFSIPFEAGNLVWGRQFVEATPEETASQGIKNQDLVGSDEIDKAVEVSDSSISPSAPSSFGLSNTQKVVAVVAILGIGFLGYKLLNK